MAEDRVGGASRWGARWWRADMDPRSRDWGIDCSTDWGTDWGADWLGHWLRRRLGVWVEPNALRLVGWARWAETEFPEPMG